MACCAAEWDWPRELDPAAINRAPMLAEAAAPFERGEAGVVNGPDHSFGMESSIELFGIQIGGL